MSDFGIYVFNSWKEALDNVIKDLNNHEKGITCTEINCAFNNDHIKIFDIKKSDNSKKLAVIIKKAKAKDLWMNWTPSEDHFECIDLLPSFVEEVEEYNKKNRR